MLSREQTIEQVSLQADTLTYPTMTSAEVATIVDRSRRFTLWAGSTAYTIGDRIVSTPANGRIYECVVAGTSQSTQPPFPLTGGYVGQVFDDDSTGVWADGNDLLWADVGPQPSEQYDSRMATRQCWLMKAARCASEVDSNGVSLNQLLNNCLRMAERYKAVVVV
jgi:hypothetical protein